MGEASRVQPLRFLKREPKFRAPKRCESVPNWRIIPDSRPLYVCKQCNFANIFGELCLWCRGNCVVSFKISTLRRRVSAPQLLNDAQKAQLHVADRPVAVLRVARPALGSREEALSQLTRLLRSVSGEPPEPQGQRRRRHRDAAVFTVEKLAVGQLTTQNGPFSHSIVPPTPVASPTEVSRPIFSFPRAPSTSSESSRPAEKYSAATLLPFPRTLRRRKRISLKKTSSSFSIRSRLPQSPTSQGEVVSIEITKSDVDAVRGRSDSDSPSEASISSTLPLGHPGRPLYTAIRRNMFSATPGLSAQHPRFPPVRALSAASDTESRLSGDWVSIPSFYPTTDGHGFSLSGETELLMALARRDNVGDGADLGVGEYKFRETKQIRAGKCQRGLKRIGRGLKDFFSLRSRL